MFLLMMFPFVSPKNPNRKLPALSGVPAQVYTSVAPVTSGIDGGMAEFDPGEG